VRAGEGYLSAEKAPSSGADFVHATFSRRGEKEESYVPTAITTNSP